MINRKTLFNLTMPRPRKAQEGKEYQMCRQSLAVDGTPVQVYTAFDLSGAAPAPYFRTFCYQSDGRDTHQSYVWLPTDRYGTDAERTGNRWSRAGIDSFIYRYHQSYGRTQWTEPNANVHFPRVQGAQNAERLYQYQFKIREEALKVKHTKIRLTTAEIMNQIRPLPKDLDQFLVNRAFIASRYIYYKTLKTSRAGGKAVRTMQGFCTHCLRDVTWRHAAPGTLHNAAGRCPLCGSRVQYKAENKTKYLQDDLRFLVAQPLKNGIIIRGFSATRDYIDHYRAPTMHTHEYYRIVLSYSGELSYFSWDWVSEPGGIYRNHREWKRHGPSGLNYPTDGVLYAKNLRHTLKGTPWQYSGLYEMAKGAAEPFCAGDYLKEYMKHPVFEYLAKLGLYRVVSEHLPVVYRGMMGHYYKAPADYVDLSTVNIRGKSMAEVLPTTDKRDLPALIAADASVGEIRLFARARAAGCAITARQLRALRKLCDERAYRRMEDIMQYARPERIIEYVKQASAAKGKPNRADLLSDWADYLGNAALLGWNMTDTKVLYPHDLKAAHDHASELVEYKRNEKYDAAIAAKAPEWAKRYSFTHKGLTIVAPAGSDDIVQEGKALGHCVANYIAKVASGQTTILFVRTVAEPDKPYYTMEVHDNTVYQCRGHGNADMTPEVEVFVKAFKKARMTQKQARKAG